MVGQKKNSIKSENSFSICFRQDKAHILGQRKKQIVANFKGKGGGGGGEGLQIIKQEKLIIASRNSHRISLISINVIL